jgi:5-methylthioadenosine/S-adenosylhomocysteine deaminase
MSQLTADLIIEARWILPMTEPRALLENHSLAVKNGRIVDLLPQAAARSRYGQALNVQRPNHLLMPGLIDAHARAGMSLFRGLPEMSQDFERRFATAEFVRDAVLLSIAEMLRAGITCFGDAYIFPNETANAAAEQGIRACVGLPVADAETAWARTPGEYIGKALSVRDEYKGHPAVTTVFAPHASHTLSDDTLAQVRTLADELDCGVTMPLHQTDQEIRSSIARFGNRPIARLDALGLLTPALNAVHMVHIAAGELELAQRSGISVTLCPVSNLRLGHGAAPVARWAGSGNAVSLGSDSAAFHGLQDLWCEARTAALLSRYAPDGPAALAPWDALAMATRDGAAALGLADQVGTLEAGKWADLCCVDLDHPAMQPMRDPAAQLVFCGGRDRVSDVWVSGRDLVSGFRLTRLDWPEVSNRARTRAALLKC